jgi:hypothetical protein
LDRIKNLRTIYRTCKGHDVKLSAPKSQFVPNNLPRRGLQDDLLDLYLPVETMCNVAGGCKLGARSAFSSTVAVLVVKPLQGWHLAASPDVGVIHKVHGCERVDSTWHTAFSKDRFPTLLKKPWEQVQTLV